MWFGPIAAKADISVVPAVAGVAEGVVVDLGYAGAFREYSKALEHLTCMVFRPGSGQNVRHFDRKKISKLYLVEPCLGLHDELKVNLEKASLEDITTTIRP